MAVDPDQTDQSNLNTGDMSGNFLSDDSSHVGQANIVNPSSNPTRLTRSRTHLAVSHAAQGTVTQVQTQIPKMPAKSSRTRKATPKVNATEDREDSYLNLPDNPGFAPDVESNNDWSAPNAEVDQVFDGIEKRLDGRSLIAVYLLLVAVLAALAQILFFWTWYVVCCFQPVPFN